MTPFIVILVSLVGFIAIVSVAHVYNHLVLVKNNVRRAWSDILVLLRQRQDELGKLVVVCRAHADYEKDVLERVATARSEMQQALTYDKPSAVGRAERGLRQELKQAILLGEAHPVLRADESFQHLSRRISELETAIADRREFYNAQVEINNNAIESFPEIVLAGSFGFRAAQLLVFDTQKKR